VAPRGLLEGVHWRGSHREGPQEGVVLMSSPGGDQLEGVPWRRSYREGIMGSPGTGPILRVPSKEHLEGSPVGCPLEGFP
jgi:hypothetical protein